MCPHKRWQKGLETSFMGISLLPPLGSLQLKVLQQRSVSRERLAGPRVGREQAQEQSPSPEPR